MGYQDLELRESNTRPLKKSVFKYFRQISPVKKFRQQKISNLVNCDIVSAAKQKANGSYKCSCRNKSVKVNKRSGQEGISNLFLKKSKISAFFDENWPKKILATNITACRSIEYCSID